MRLADRLRLNHRHFVCSGADALIQFSAPILIAYKVPFELAGVTLLMLMNMRGVRESVVPLVPVFMVFIVTHLFAILYGIGTHHAQGNQIVTAGINEVGTLHSSVGIWGIVFLILKSFSLGAGTFTGIEAVSNGLPILRDPKVQTGKKTMVYMAISLAFTVVGLMICYLLFDVHSSAGKTLNATLFEQLTASWGSPWGGSFILVTLLSETMLLFVAAQAGFLDGPRILASMALDRWVPSRFSSFSDRLVTQNGILVMGIASLVILAITQGSVATLVVLYSINVFITFCLSQSGMVVHWWKNRQTERTWKKKISINGLGLLLTGFILVSMIILKFHEGGWMTLVLTAVLALCAWTIKQHYQRTLQKLEKLSSLLTSAKYDIPQGVGIKETPYSDGRTAIILVNGYNGLGIHTLLNVLKIFGKDCKNFVFIQIGVIDAGNFKDSKEFRKLKASVEENLQQYEQLLQSHGYFAKGHCAFGTDVTEEIEQLTVRLMRVYDHCIVFGGQLVFERETFLHRMLHNYTVFAVHKRLYHQGIPMMILPIRL